MGDLVRGDPTVILAELVSLGMATPEEIPPDYRIYRHQTPGERELSVISNTEVYDLDQAAFYHFGIRRWRHVSVSVIGQLHARLADQKAIGRQRGPGERSPAPLPDWYDLNHIAYAHWEELGFDPNAPVFQLLPPPDSPYLNIAEALHLRQPA